MARKVIIRKKEPKITNQGITRITVQGFKSLANETTVDIKPLTILAGANSSGKSSVMQPLLMLKQTLEETYDPGPLQINGNLIKFTSAEQFLSHSIRKRKMGFNYSLGINSKDEIKWIYEKNKKIELVEMVINGKETIHIRKDMPKEELDNIASFNPDKMPIRFSSNKPEANIKIINERCFFKVLIPIDDEGSLFVPFPLFFHVEHLIMQTIHLPGLRGNPSRSYPKTLTKGKIPGTFIDYVASIISNWKDSDDPKLTVLEDNLFRLGLTGKVNTRFIDDASIEIEVGRTIDREKKDFVSIADVGFGVSQVMPILVALLAANPGQLVYVEQPELHLHPRAQIAMAEILAEAAKRGVKVVVETHSPLIILTVQSLVAEGKIDPGIVALHWFHRNKKGITEVTTAELDPNGAYGDWPVDFGDVSLAAESRYLNTPLK